MICYSPGLPRVSIMYSDMAGTTPVYCVGSLLVLGPCWRGPTLRWRPSLCHSVFVHRKMWVLYRECWLHGYEHNISRWRRGGVRARRVTVRMVFFQLESIVKRLRQVRRFSDSVNKYFTQHMFGAYFVFKVLRG